MRDFERLLLRRFWISQESGINRESFVRCIKNHLRVREKKYFLKEKPEKRKQSFSGHREAKWNAE